jgi:hypothetical protein
MAERQIRSRKGHDLPTVIEEASEEHAEYYCSDASDSDTEVPVIISCEQCKLGNMWIHAIFTQRKTGHIKELKMHFFDVWHYAMPRRVKDVQDYYAWLLKYQTKMHFFAVWRSIVPRRIKHVEDYYALFPKFQTTDIWVLD